MNIIKNIYYKILNIKSDFDKLFFEKEYAVLTEKFGFNFILIVFILFLTFFAFSFSIGSMDYLDKRMNDPFTNWVDVPITVKVKNKLDDIVAYFEKDSVKNRIYLNNVSTYIIFFRNFYDKSLNDLYQIKGRTVQDTSSLFEKIISNSNVIGKFQKEDIKNTYQNCGIIVTQELLKNLNYNTGEIPHNIFLEQSEGVISLPVAAVVKTLPNNSQYIFSNSLYNMSYKPYESGFVTYQETTNIVKIISSKNIKTGLKEQFISDGIQIEDINRDMETFKADNKILYTIIFSGLHVYNEIKKEIKNVLKNEDSYGIYFNNECPAVSDFIKRPHRIAFNFVKLDKIREFKDLMQNKFEIEVSMAQVETKENFSLVSNLTFILSLILFVFSTISILFFINSILTKHLQQIKANLGTIKTFGVSNKKLLKIYLKIIFTYLFVSGILAYALNGIISLIINYYLNDVMFKYYSIYIITIFIIIIIFSILNSKYSILKVLKNTPGDLIYNRK